MSTSFITLLLYLHPFNEPRQVIHAYAAQVLIRSDQANAAGFTGAGQAVAVIDTGVDYTIPSMGGGSFPNSKVVGGTDIKDPDNDPMDCEGHGTEVAGIAAGPGGVAPGAKIVAIKVFHSTTASNASCDPEADFSDIAAGLDYAVTNKGTFNITVANISLGGDFIDDDDHGFCDADDPGSRLPSTPRPPRD
jgi:subtilisin family serine protease